MRSFTTLGQDVQGNEEIARLLVSKPEFSIFMSFCGGRVRLVSAEGLVASFVDPSHSQSLPRFADFSDLKKAHPRE